MIGLEDFISIFGNITIAQIITLIFALFFCWKIYKEIKKFFEHKKDLLIKKHELEQEKDNQLKTALEEVSKYPQYREQSKKIQQHFQYQIDELKNSQDKIINVQEEVCTELKQMQQDLKNREKNKLQDRLLQSYRFYTDIKRNPEQKWTSMEAQAFWALFTDYEDAGGNGYIHTVVQPAMKLLKIIDE